MDDTQDPGRRQPWQPGPDEGEDGWLSLSDDELLYRVELLGDGHGQDARLMEVIGSGRHFFVRQEAAKKVQDKKLLKGHFGDRHIGQILVRGMTRSEDIEYLEHILSESSHLEVRKAADAQLRLLRGE
jgi:hypothetical protein